MSLDHFDYLTPPHSIEAEQAVLGAILVDAETVLPRVSHLQPGQFYRAEHQEIYRAVQALASADAPIDLNTVRQRLRTANNLERTGGIDYLVDLMQSVATTASAEYLANSIVSTARLRRRIQKGKELVQACYEGNADQASALLEELKQTELDEPKARPVLPASERLLAQSQYLEKHRGKEYTGYIQKTLPTLDIATRGLQALTTIAAGPGSGKTTLVEQMCIDALHQNPNLCCLFVSLEMPESTILTRWQSRVLQIPFNELLTANTPDMIAQANQLIEPIARRFAIIDREINPAVTAEAIIDAGEKLLYDTGSEHIIIAIDYFQRFPIPSELKDALRVDAQKDDYRCEQIYKIRDAFYPDPLLVISQANKTEGFRASGMSSVKGSSDIVYDADSVILVNPLDDDELVDCVRKEGYGTNISFRLARKHEKEEARNSKKPERITAAENMREDMSRMNTDFVELVIPKVRGGTKKRIILEHRHNLSDMRELAESGPIFREPFSSIKQPESEDLFDFTPEMDGLTMQGENSELF